MTKNNDDDYVKRVNNILDNGTKKQTDEELAQRFNKVFLTEPIVNQKNPSYHIPENAYSDDIDKEIERMLEESDDGEDAIDSYIYGVLDSSSTEDIKSTNMQEKMDGFNKLFMGSDSGLETDESQALIRRLQEENALEAKYKQFNTATDQDMEKRYQALKQDPPKFSSYESSGERPRGSAPKPIQKEDLHDEMDDWCCICNDDATIECEGCEDDNRYCKECFFHTHRGESADYEATKHKSKRYQK